MDETDITEMYGPIGGLKWLFSDYRESEVNLLENSFRLDPGELPVSAQFRVSGDKELPCVIRKIKLKYPGGTTEAQKINFMEVWITADNKSRDYAMVFRGDPNETDSAQEIVIHPFIGNDVLINFYSSYGDGEAVLPTVQIFGNEDVSETGVYPEDRKIAINGVGFMNDEAIGKVFISRSPTESGFKYISRSETNITARQGEDGELNTIPFTSSCECNVDGSFYVENCKCFHKAGEFVFMKKQCESRFSFVVEDSLGEKEDKSYDTDEVVTEESMFDALADGGFAIGLKKNFNLFLWGDGDVQTVTAEIVTHVPDRDENGDAWFVWTHDKKYRAYNTMSLVRDDGTPVRTFDFKLGIEASFEENPDDWEIGALVLDPELRYRDMLKGVRDFIRVPGKVSNATIFIRWNELRPETLVLESDRQRLISLEEVEPGIFEAELETIARYPGEEGFREAEYLSDVELETYLLPDRVVRSDMKEFITLADEIVGDETDPVKISELIFNWLIDNMFPDLSESFEVEPANIIMNKMRGDCKHFATMFATLARAKEIPTRFAIGHRYIGGQYGYHVWNQIYVDGYWIDVDASSTFFYPGALHIQMDVTPSFNAKSNIGVLLGLRPEPEIIDWETFEPEYHALKNSLDTITSDKFYQDAYFRFRMDFPEGFGADVMDLGFMRKIDLEYQDDDRLKAVVFVIPSEKDNPSIQDVFSSIGSETIQLMDLFGKIKKFAGKKMGDTKISGRSAKFFLGSFMDQDGTFIKMDITFLPIGNRLFIFFFYGPSETYDRQSKNLGSIKESIQILD